MGQKIQRILKRLNIFFQPGIRSYIDSVHTEICIKYKITVGSRIIISNNITGLSASG